VSKEKDILLSEYLSANAKNMSIDKDSLDKKLTEIYGYQPTIKDWPFANNNYGLNFGIKQVDTMLNSLELSFNVSDATTNEEVSQKCQITMSRNDGGIKTHLYSLHRNPYYKGKAKVGEAFTKLMHKMLNDNAKKTGNTNQLTLHAESNDRGYTGGYNWASHAYSFSDEKELNSMRSSFKSGASINGITLTDEDMKHFTHPCHFAAFDFGRTYVVDKNKNLKLTDEQIKTKSISCKQGEHPLTDYELKSGSTSRLAAPFGKSRLLDSEWWGTWETGNDNSEANRYFKTLCKALDTGKSREVAYKTAFMVLSPEYKKVVQKARQQYQAKNNALDNVMMNAARKPR